MPNIIKPQALKKGDLIGIISPASPVADPAKVERGIRYLEKLGYSVRVGASVYKSEGYLAGTDQERVADIESMFEDRRVRAIICVRGGYGSPRLLPLINYRTIARNPKILVGFSDVTALQLAIWKKCRLVTFHGPMLAVDMAEDVDPFTEDLFWRIVTSRKKIGTVPSVPDHQPVTLHPGTSTGRLLGGNISLVCSLLGTPYQPQFSDTILFVEEIGEEPYRIDRMFTQLRNSSLLAKTNAILTGQFLDCQPKDPSRPSFAVEDILIHIARISRKPFLSNLPFGHGKRKMTLPIGLTVRVNATAGSVHYLESAVA